MPLPDGDVGVISKFHVSRKAVFLAGAFRRAAAYRLAGAGFVPAFSTSVLDHWTMDLVAEKDGTIWLARAGLWRAQRQPGADQDSGATLRVRAPGNRRGQEGFS